jgi:ABC-2 type transport system ATP-binding protein
VASSPAIRTTAVRKSYGPVHALAGVDLEVEPGEVFALLGPNGAGKSTFVEILEGYRKRDSGDVAVLGIDPATQSREWKSRIGIVPQSAGYFEELTVEEIVGHFATFYPHPMQAGRAIGLVGLEEKRRARCRSLSGGQKRRVDLALALVGDPDLIFLDEPTTGFDPAARHQAWDVVAEMTLLGKTILLTTHYLDEAEFLAKRVGVILHGQMLEVGTPRELGGRAQAPTRVTFDALPPLSLEALPRVPGIVATHGDRVYVETNEPTRVVEMLASWATASGVSELPNLTVARPTLEEIYLSMLKGPSGAPHQPGSPSSPERLN